jgi:hypothetical protein
MDFGPLLAKVMTVAAKTKDLADTIEEIHQEIQRMIVTKAEVNEINIHEEE